MNEYSIAPKLTNQSAGSKPVTRQFWKTLLVEIISGLLLLLFSYTAVSKLIDHNQFVEQLGKSPYLEPYATIVAWVIPIAESLIALLLLFKKTRLTGLFASFALMLAFTIYIYEMLHYSYYVPCSCGGVLAAMSWTQHFWFNVLFTLLTLTGILLAIAPSGNSKKPSS
jgi:hypothetical protein